MRKGPQGQRIGKGPDRGACDQANIPGGSLDAADGPQAQNDPHPKWSTPAVVFCCSTAQPAPRLIG